MKTYTNQNTSIKFNVTFASSLPSGYGHRQITAEIKEEGTNNHINVTALTDNMPDFEEANDLEGQDKFEALFELIEHKVGVQIEDWFFENN